MFGAFIKSEPISGIEFQLFKARDSIILSVWLFNQSRVVDVKFCDLEFMAEEDGNSTILEDLSIQVPEENQCVNLNLIDTSRLKSVRINSRGLSLTEIAFLSLHLV